MLLDEAPGLQELIFGSSPLPWDVLVWVGERCTALRTLLMGDRQADYRVQFARSLTPERFLPLQRPPLLPSLTSCALHCDALPEDSRAASFALPASYLAHNAPAPVYLSLPHSSCWGITRTCCARWLG